MVDDKATHTANESTEKTKQKSDESFFGVIGDVARNAWQSLRNIEDKLINAGTPKQDGSEELPKVALASDDKNGNKLWEFFGKQPDTSSLCSPQSEVLSTVATQKLGQRSDKQLESQPVSFLDRAWNYLFPETHKYSRDQQDADGKPTKLEWGPNGVDHTTDHSKTHVDGKRAFHLSENGDQAIMDRKTKELSEKGANGTYAIMDANGKFAVSDTSGNKIEWQNGKLVATARDGSTTEVTDERVIRRFKQTQWRIEQSRRADQRLEDGKDGPKVQTVTDEANKGQQMVVVDDGKGTIVKIHQDGSKEIIVGKTEEQVTFMTKPGSNEVLAVRGDELYVLKPGDKCGQWDAYDIEGNKIADVEAVIGGHCHANESGGLKLSESTEISNDGTIQTGNDHGHHVHIANDGNAAVLKNTDGAGTDVSVSTHGAKSAVTSCDTSGTITTTTTDTENNTVKREAITADGKQSTLFSLDPLSKEYLKIGTPDGEVTASRDDRGHEKIRLWNGDILDGKNHTLHLKDGTIFDAEKGDVRFSDGTRIGADGLIYDGDIRIGGIGTDWDEPEEAAETEAQIQSLAAQAEALAASIIAKAGDASLGDIGALLALYSQLGGLKALAAAAGDLGSMVKIDGGLTATDAAIQNARVQIAQQQILTALGGMSPDLLAQANNMMPGSVSHEAIKTLLTQKGVGTTAQSSS